MNTRCIVLLFVSCVYLTTGDSVKTTGYPIKEDNNDISIVFFCKPGDEKCLNDPETEQTFDQWITGCIHLCSTNPVKDPDHHLSRNNDSFIISCTLRCLQITAESHNKDEYGDNNVTANNKRPDRTLSTTIDQLKKKIIQKLINLSLPSDNGK